MRHPRRILVLAAAVAAVGAAAAWFAGRSRDTSLDTSPNAGIPATESPYRNIRPDVRYVGDAACAPCHPDIDKTYHRHPMGRDLSPVTGPLPGERFGKDAQNPFEKFGLQFRVEHGGGKVTHKVTGPGVERTDEVAFAVGSGARGRSYVVNRDGFLFQSPVSWYADPGVWDLSPGFTRDHLGGLPVEAGCLFCHSNRAEPVAGTVNRYRNVAANAAAVGCERCHGPGQLHVEHHASGGAAAGPDDTIVNPKHLEPALREAVCQQCHYTSSYRVLRRGRGAFDYRPGLPLQEFWTVFTRPPRLAEDHRHANRVEQMHASRCYQAGAGKMGCTSCHDPHGVPRPEEAVAFYRNRCLTCHQEKGCGLPAETRRRQVATDSCVACHMPRQGSKKAVHVSDTDHRIVRRPEPAAPRAPLAVRPGEELLLPFHRGLPGPDGVEVGRDLGVALAKVADDTPALRAHAGRQALPLLDAAVRRWPDDAPAWQARARVQRLLGRPDAALADLRAALAAAPDHEAVLADAAAAAGELRAWPAARDYWARAAAVNPWSAAYREKLAEAHYNQWEWTDAIRASREALRLDPTRLDARVVLVSALLATGDRAGAKAAFEALLALNPPNADELRRWYADQTR